MRVRPSGWGEQVKTDEGLRRALLKFIADFSNWDNAADTEYLETSQRLVRAAHPGEAPLVVDPFAGGGAIPLESLRLGCEAFASDLNPVACLILQVMLYDIPRHGSGLAEKLRRVGLEIKALAERKLAELYPKDSDSATPIAYLWARTVRCESPNCGAEIPLMRSMWLCRKSNRKWALKANVVRTKGIPPRVEFEVFEPESDDQVAAGTVARARATCVCCRAVMEPERVQAQLTAQNGGADAVFDEHGNRVGGARMTAVVTVKLGEKGRRYRQPTEADYNAVRLAQERVAEMVEGWERGGRQGLCPVPDEPLPLMSGTFNVPLYGMNTWGSLFTARQKVALIAIARLVQRRPSDDLSLIRTVIAMCLDKVAMQNSSCCRWKPSGESLMDTFGRQALPMVWDFAESSPISGSTGDFGAQMEWIVRIVDDSPIRSFANVQSADATAHPLPDQSAGVWFTDPPYYFAVPYADLSDFFFVWLKRALPDHPLLNDPFNLENRLTPKDPELCEMAHWDSVRYSHKDQQFFEDGMTAAFAEGRRLLREDGMGSVVFAHKTTEGWEALLAGLIRADWTVTGSWPIATEMGSRLRARESAALATSVHLICRPRPEDAPVGDWADVLRELPVRVGDWMQRLQGEGVRGADLVFACVGPALEVYSRYARVETAEGRGVELPEFLEKVWEVVGREALEQILGTAEAQARNGAAGALEEDARLTALFLWTIQSTAGGTLSGSGNGADNVPADAEESPRRKPTNYGLPFDVVRRFAQPLGIHLDDWESRIIRTKKGVVRLLPVTERGTQLFGEAGADALADAFESNAAASPQLRLFPEEPPSVRGRARRGRAAADELEARHGATTLDRIHAAMLLQASGRSQALRNLLRAEQERGPDFLRLANAFSALYPTGSEEKRLLDAMLLAAPR
ncbi:MAG: hypothetical protein OXI80_09140 [Caldilineaceae bacterium]|nr:hypothetical protein [Caldilineaceae bacterium]MDE0337822.1 hypothetical protein [Caldilineaceae bacterium]